MQFSLNLIMVYFLLGAVGLYQTIRKAKIPLKVAFLFLIFLNRLQCGAKFLLWITFKGVGNGVG